MHSNSCSAKGGAHCALLHFLLSFLLSFLPSIWTFRGWNEDVITQKGIFASRNSNASWEAWPTGCHRRGASLEV